MSFVIKILITFTYVLHILHEWILGMIYRRKPPAVPPMDNPLLRYSAATLAKMIRDGEVSSQAVVEAYVRRIKEVNPHLNAVVEDRFENAIAEAKACDEKLRSGEVTGILLEKEKPLYGIPITVKGSCAVRGLNHSVGGLPRKDVKATEDAVSVKLLKSAGAIPLCVTNVPEMCTSLQTSNYLQGHTSNPYDTRYTAGGSSGGEGALIGAGASLIGLGSDIAGSIRLPAQFNGTFGHKPSPGILSLEGHFPSCDDPDFKKYLVLGPLTRYADDLHLAMKVLASKCERELRLDEPIHPKGLRVYYTDSIDANYKSLRLRSPDIKQRIKDAVDYLRASGATVEQLSDSWLNGPFAWSAGTFFSMKTPPDIYNDPKNPTATVGPICEFTKAMLGLSKFTRSNALAGIMLHYHALMPSSVRKRCQESSRKMQQKITDLLKDDGVLIVPTWPNSAPRKGFAWTQWYAATYCAMVNVLGTCATHVPMGLDRNGLPIGFQVIAAPYQDRLCLGLARQLEKKFGGWVPPTTS